MSDEVWSARCKNKKNTVEQLKKITLNTDNAGQYQHDDVIKFIEQLKQVAKEQFNPLDKNNGMSKLFDKNRNTINNITKPTFEISAQKMATRSFPMMWFCEMANSVMGENGKLLEYRHLIANPKTRATALVGEQR